MSISLLGIAETGFSFGLCQRNAFLAEKGYVAPTAQKTGTTIAGMIFKNGVILGADTRATNNNIIADKKSRKIHYLYTNVYCCGAGIAADTEMTTEMISGQLELHHFSTNRTIPVVTATMLLKHLLFRYQGHVGAALIVGGIDNSGPHLFSIYPHGSCDTLPYTSMGSGSLAAMSVFESKWKPDMNENEAKHLVAEGIRAGVFNDLGSGNMVDLCVIRKDSVDLICPYELACTKGVMQSFYHYKKGTTSIISQSVKPIVIETEFTRKFDSN